MIHAKTDTQVAAAAAAIDEDGFPEAKAFNQAAEEASRYVDPDAYEDDPSSKMTRVPASKTLRMPPIQGRMTNQRPAWLSAQKHFGDVYDSLRSHIYC